MHSQSRLLHFFLRVGAFVLLAACLLAPRLTLAAAPALASLTLQPVSVIGGVSSTALVTLTGIVPAGGAAVAIKSSNVGAVVPASIAVAANTTTKTFAIVTKPVAASTTVTITAVFGSVTKTAILTILPAPLSSLVLSPVSVSGGAPVTGTVSFGGLLGANASVGLASSNPAAAMVVSPLAVAAGSSSKTFAIVTKPVAVSTVVTLTAAYGGVSKTATFTILPPALSALTVQPVSVIGGVAAKGIVTLASPAPANFTVTITSNNANAAPPATVLVAANTSSATFTIVTKAVPVSVPITIAAKLGSVTKTATLTVTPASLSALNVSPVSVTGGASVAGTVSFTGALAANASIVLTSSNTAAATVVSPLVAAAGASVKTFTIVTKPVSVSTVLTITAKYGAVTKTAALTILPPALSAFTLQPIAVVGGQPSTGTIVLTGLAPAAGALVVVTSNNTHAIPQTPVVIAANTALKTFLITTTAVTAVTPVTLTVAYGGVSKTATLALSPPLAAYAGSYVGSAADVTGGASATLSFTVNTAGSLTGTALLIDNNGIPSTVVVTGSLSNAGILSLIYHIALTATATGHLTLDPVTHTLSGSLQEVLTGNVPGDLLYVTIGSATTPPLYLGHYSGRYASSNGDSGTIAFTVGSNAAVTLSVVDSSSETINFGGYLDKSGNIFGAFAVDGDSHMIVLHLTKNGSVIAITGTDRICGIPLTSYSTLTGSVQ